ncbi:MAG TPA: hypothetical protein VJV23_10675, partial [Candidatus Polarisedimenticolia bacterium]|nr:hypothetical protein [Candidatus Polarisedimenticolia bacterium]
PAAGPAAARPASPAGGAFAEAVLERVTQRRMSAATFLAQAAGVRLEGDDMVISVLQKQVFVKTALESPETIALLRDEASAAAGRPVGVRVEVASPPSDDLSDVAAAAGSEPVNETARRREQLLDEAMKEPVVRAVMDLFKGQIVDIREGR